MKGWIIPLLLTAALAGCQPAPVKFAEPPKDAPEWNLNPDRWQGTNNLIEPPGPM